MPRNPANRLLRTVKIIESETIQHFAATLSNLFAVVLTSRRQI